MAKRKLSLSATIMIGLVLGVGCGLFFGESVAFLGVIGSGFVRLLQMTIMPYIVVSLITGIGTMTLGQAKALAVRGLGVFVVIWSFSVLVVLTMQFAFPAWESASFFSTADLALPEAPDYLSTYIPSNPFASLANNVVPAVVLFSAAIGIALIGIEKKERLVHSLSVMGDALTKVAHFVVKLAPIGVFAISASAAGTMTLDEFGRLQVFFVTYVVAALLLALWVLPMLITVATPFRYRDVMRVSRDALVTAFATGNLFITLPVLIEGCKKLYEDYGLTGGGAHESVDILLPVSFNFPSAGRLLNLIFLLFAAWFTGSALSGSQYPRFVISGVLSFFAAGDIAVPYLLDSMRLPADLFQLFVVSRVVTGRFGAVAGCMSLLTFTLITTSGTAGAFAIRRGPFLRFIVGTGIMVVGAVFLSRIFLAATVDNEYRKDKVVAGMQILMAAAEAEYGEATAPAGEDPAEGALARIRKRGVLRVGYLEKRLPFAYRNGQGDIVGFDIDMAHRLARDLEVKLMLIPASDDIGRDLDTNLYDVAMTGLAISPTRALRMGFSEPYMDVTLAFLVADHRRREFENVGEVRNRKGLRIGVPTEGFYLRFVQRGLPNAEVVPVTNYEDFFEERGLKLDAMVTAAEAGSAVTLLYPRFSVVIPHDDRVSIPLAYPVALRDREFRDFLSLWVDLQKKNGVIKGLHAYWIQGRSPEAPKPRWSVPMARGGLIG